MRFMEIPPDLVAEVERHYGANDVTSVRSLLSELHSERVQRAVLHLADGDIDRFLHFVSRAQEDYRDVIFWAEEPRGDDEPRTYEDLRSRLRLPPEEPS